MFTSLLDEVRIWPLLWRRRLACSWLLRDKGNIAFLAVLGLMVLAVAAIIYLAYEQEAPIEAVPVEAVRREATRAQRRASDLRCLAENIYFEARGEPIAGQYDVADFSWTESGTLSPEDGAAWRQAMTIATAVYDDTNEPLVPGALFYHATSVRPGWASARKTVARIGNHIFYR